jgi:hypothetical protein
LLQEDSEPLELPFCSKLFGLPWMPNKPDFARTATVNADRMFRSGSLHVADVPLFYQEQDFFPSFFFLIFLGILAGHGRGQVHRASVGSVRLSTHWEQLYYHQKGQWCLGMPVAGDVERKLLLTAFTGAQPCCRSGSLWCSGQ